MAQSDEKKKPTQVKTSHLVFRCILTVKNMEGKKRERERVRERRRRRNGDASSSIQSRKTRSRAIQATACDPGHSVQPGSLSLQPLFLFLVFFFFFFLLWWTHILLWWTHIAVVVVVFFAIVFVVVVVVFFVLFLDVNWVLETRFPGRCHVEKVSHQTWTTHENRVPKTQFIDPKSSLLDSRC